MYLLAVGLPIPGMSRDNDSDLLIDALATVRHDSGRTEIKVAYVKDTPQNAAIILADAPFFLHPNSEQIEITQDRVIGVVASSKAYDNSDGAMKSLNMDNIDSNFCRASHSTIRQLSFTNLAPA